MSADASAPWLIAGATGYIGGKLAEKLCGDGRAVRAMTRDRTRPHGLDELGCEVVEADVLEQDTLPDVVDGVSTAFYLVHSMGRGGDGGYADRDRQAAENFAGACEQAGVEHIVYLGGLAATGSEHLDSREETGRILASSRVPVTWLRAAAVLGAGSESFLTAYYLAKRLPVMVTPKWAGTPTQPIAIRDTIAFLAASPTTPGTAGREVEIGGRDVTTYEGMLDAIAHALGRRIPAKLRVPLLTPSLSSLWLGLVTPVDTEVARPIVEGMKVQTTVTDPSGMALYDLETLGLDEAMRAAIDEMDD